MPDHPKERQVKSGRCQDLLSAVAVPLVLPLVLRLAVCQFSSHWHTGPRALSILLDTSQVTEARAGGSKTHTLATLPRAKAKTL